MIEAWTADQVRAAEEVLLRQTPDGELMRRAAHGLAQVTRERAGALGARRLVVLVGSGNNGGDALYAGAALADLLSVTVVRVAGTAHPGGLRAVTEAGVPVLSAGEGDLGPRVREALAGADLVLDGMLGLGGRGGLRGAAAAVADAVGEGAYVIAVDLPSGADPAGEQALGAAVSADETVTFGCPKPVHLLAATEPAVGRLSVVDIGLTLPGRAPVQRVEAADVPDLWPRPGAGDDKYSRGVLGVVAGSESYPGAAVLTVSAAVQAGAGMVRYVGPPTPTSLVLRAVPEAVPRAGRVQAWVVGPGVDAQDGSIAGRAQVQAVGRALASDLPCLVDAGALELFREPRSAPTLLTPHAGELASLLRAWTGGRGPDRSEVESEPVRWATRAVELTGATVLLKGATTLVVTGDVLRSQADAPPWLATAGAGDVLAGLAGTLLAAGLSPLDAGSLAALVHGVAADRANPGGPVRATAVASALPSTIARLLHR